MLIDLQEKLKCKGTTIVKEVCGNPYRLFNISFALYFFILNFKLVMGFSFIMGNESVPKEQLQGFFSSPALTNIFNLPDLFFLTLLILNLIFASLLIFSQNSRWIYLLAWICMNLIFIRIPAHKSVHIEYLGWLMLINLFVTDNVRKTKLAFPVMIGRATWFFFTGSYLLSGLGKLRIAEWTNGDALYFILKTDVARSTIITDLFLKYPEFTLLPTYLVLATELMGMVFIWNKKLRFLYLIISACFHLFILIFLKIADLSIGIFIFHLFLLLTFYRPLETSKIQAKI